MEKVIDRAQSKFVIDVYIKLFCVDRVIDCGLRQVFLFK